MNVTTRQFHFRRTLSIAGVAAVLSLIVATSASPFAAGANGNAALRAAGAVAVAPTPIQPSIVTAPSAPPDDAATAAAAAALAARTSGDTAGYQSALALLATAISARAGFSTSSLLQAWSQAEPSGVVAMLSGLGQLGVAYEFNAATPGVAFDCSGLVSWAWAQAGVTLPHQSLLIINQIAPEPLSAVKAGDLLYFPGHVMISLGVGDAVVEASGSQYGVRVRALNGTHATDLLVGDPTRVGGPMAGRPVVPLGASSSLISGKQSARLHVQLPGPTSCLSTASSDAFADTTHLPAVVQGAFQIADATNEETFIAGKDGNVYHNYLVAPDTWSGWSTLSGPPSGIFGSVRSGKNYLKQLELYVRSSDGQVYHLFATPGQGSGWQGWDTMGAPVSPIVGDVYEGTNYLHNQELYVLGEDGNVYHKFSTPRVGTGWSGWDSLGHPSDVTVTGDVQLGINNLCNQEIFVTGTDGNTYHSYSTPGKGSGWSAWSSLSRPAAGVIGSVAAGENALNNQELFVIGVDGKVYHNFATPGLGSGWSGWSSLSAPSGQINTKTLFVDTFPSEKVTIFTTTGEYVNTSTPGRGSGWSGWVKVA